MNTPDAYTAAETKRMMQAEDVLLKAMAENIAWREAAEIIGYAQLVEEELTGGRPW